MRDELPVVIEQNNRRFQATTPYYPTAKGWGNTQDEAVQALFAAIASVSNGRRSSPVVTKVQVRLGKIR